MGCKVSSQVQRSVAIFSIEGSQKNSWTTKENYPQLLMGNLTLVKDFCGLAPYMKKTIINERRLGSLDMLRVSGLTVKVLKLLYWFCLGSINLSELLPRENFTKES